MLVGLSQWNLFTKVLSQPVRAGCLMKSTRPSRASLGTIRSVYFHLITSDNIHWINSRTDFEEFAGATNNRERNASTAEGTQMTKK